MKSMVFLMLLVGLLILSGCEQSNKYDRYSELIDSSKPLAQGGENEVYLFMGLPNMGETVAVIDSSVTREMKLIYDEPYFLISSGKDPEELSNFLKYRNLILCGTLDSPDAVSAYIRGSLGPDLVQRAKSSGGEFFVNNNLNSRDQIILYLLAANRDSLANLVESRKDQIFETLLDRYRKRLAYQIYQQQVKPLSTFKGWPFTIQMPEFYELDRNDPQGSYISFNFGPENKAKRYIAIYSEAMQSDAITPDWLLQTRDKLAKKYLEGEETVGEPMTEAATIAGYQGLRMYGGWKNETIPGGVGGAFQTYAFWHGPGKRAFVIDTWVHHPSGGKLESLLELGMIAESIVIR